MEVGGKWEEQKALIFDHHVMVGSESLKPPKENGVHCFHDILGMITSCPNHIKKKRTKQMMVFKLVTPFV